MAKRTKLTNERAYINDKVAKALHHAQDVAAVVASLAGYVQTYSNAIQVRANTAWITFPSQRRIVLGFSYINRKIVARDKSVRGPILRVFDNATTQSELLA